jgi:hypothetical protein
MRSPDSWNIAAWPLGYRGGHLSYPYSGPSASVNTQHSYWTCTSPKDMCCVDLKGLRTQSPALGRQEAQPEAHVGTDGKNCAVEWGQ